MPSKPVSLAPAHKHTKSTSDAKKKEHDVLAQKIKDFGSRWEVRSVLQHGLSAATEACAAAAKHLLAVANVIATTKSQSRQETRHRLHQEVSDWQVLLVVLLQRDESAAEQCVAAMQLLARHVPGLIPEDGVCTALCKQFVQASESGNSRAVGSAAEALILLLAEWRFSSFWLVWLSTKAGDQLLRNLQAWLPSRFQKLPCQGTNATTGHISSTAASRQTRLDTTTAGATLSLFRLQLKLCDISQEPMKLMLHRSNLERWTHACASWMVIDSQDISKSGWEILSSSSQLLRLLGTAVWSKDLRNDPAGLLMLLQQLSIPIQQCIKECSSTNHVCQLQTSDEQKQHTWNLITATGNILWIVSSPSIWCHACCPACKSAANTEAMPHAQSEAHPSGGDTATHTMQSSTTAASHVWQASEIQMYHGQLLQVSTDLLQLLRCLVPINQDIRPQRSQHAANESTRHYVLLQGACVALALSICSGFISWYDGNTTHARTTCGVTLPALPRVRVCKGAQRAMELLLAADHAKLLLQACLPFLCRIESYDSLLAQRLVVILAHQHPHTFLQEQQPCTAGMVAALPIIQAAIRHDHSKLEAFWNSTLKPFIQACVDTYDATRGCDIARNSNAPESPGEYVIRRTWEKELDIAHAALPYFEELVVDPNQFPNQVDPFTHIFLMFYSQKCHLRDKPKAEPQILLTRLSAILVSLTFLLVMMSGPLASMLAEQWLGPDQEFDTFIEQLKQLADFGKCSCLPPNLGYQEFVTVWQFPACLAHQSHFCGLCQSACQTGRANRTTEPHTDELMQVVCAHVRREVGCAAAAVLSKLFSQVEYGAPQTLQLSCSSFENSLHTADGSTNCNVKLALADGQELHANALAITLSPVLLTKHINNFRADYQHSGETHQHHTAPTAATFPAAGRTSILHMKAGVPVTELQAVLHYLHTGTCNLKPLLTGKSQSHHDDVHVMGEQETAPDRAVLLKLAKSLGLHQLAALLKASLPQPGSCLSPAGAPCQPLMLAMTGMLAELRDGRFHFIQHDHSMQHNTVHSQGSGQHCSCAISNHPSLEPLLRASFDWYDSNAGRLPHSVSQRDVPKSALPLMCDALLAVPPVSIHSCIQSHDRQQDGSGVHHSVKSQQPKHCEHAACDTYISCSHCSHCSSGRSTMNDACLFSVHRSLLASGSDVLSAACSEVWLHHAMEPGVMGDTDDMNNNRMQPELRVITLPGITDAAVAWSVIAFAYTRKLYIQPRRQLGVGSGDDGCDICSTARTCLRVAYTAGVLLMNDLISLCREAITEGTLLADMQPTCILCLLLDAYLLGLEWALDPLLQRAAACDADLQGCEEWHTLPTTLQSAVRNAVSHTETR